MKARLRGAAIVAVRWIWLENGAPEEIVTLDLRFVGFGSFASIWPVRIMSG